MKKKRVMGTRIERLMDSQGSILEIKNNIPSLYISCVSVASVGKAHLDNEELANLPDTTLEDDLQELKYLPDTEPDPEVPHHVPECHRSTLNDAEEEELHPANYIQESPTNLVPVQFGEKRSHFSKNCGKSRSRMSCRGGAPLRTRTSGSWRSG